jgi:hypothetical protein
MGVPINIVEDEGVIEFSLTNRRDKDKEKHRIRMEKEDYCSLIHKTKCWYVAVNKCGWVSYVMKNNLETKRLDLLHRVIVKKFQDLPKFKTGGIKNMVVDHRDRNTLNNVRSNLRVVTVLENILNRRTHKNSLGVKYRGISISYNEKGENRYIAEFRGKYIASCISLDRLKTMVNERWDEKVKPRIWEHRKGDKA